MINLKFSKVAYFRTVLYCWTKSNLVELALAKNAEMIWILVGHLECIFPFFRLIGACILQLALSNITLHFCNIYHLNHSVLLHKIIQTHLKRCLICEICAGRKESVWAMRTCSSSCQKSRDRPASDVLKSYLVSRCLKCAFLLPTFSRKIVHHSSYMYVVW